MTRRRGTYKYRSVSERVKKWDKKLNPQDFGIILDKVKPDALEFFTQYQAIQESLLRTIKPIVDKYGHESQRFQAYMWFAHHVWYCTQRYKGEALKRMVDISYLYWTGLGLNANVLRDIACSLGICPDSVETILKKYFSLTIGMATIDYAKLKEVIESAISEADYTKLIKELKDSFIKYFNYFFIDFEDESYKKYIITINSEVIDYDYKTFNEKLMKFAVSLPFVNNSIFGMYLTCFDNIYYFETTLQGFSVISNYTVKSYLLKYPDNVTVVNNLNNIIIFKDVKKALKININANSTIPLRIIIPFRNDLIPTLILRFYVIVKDKIPDIVFNFVSTIAGIKYDLYFGTEIHVSDIINYFLYDLYNNQIVNVTDYVFPINFAVSTNVLDILIENNSNFDVEIVLLPVVVILNDVSTRQNILLANVTTGRNLFNTDTVRSFSIYYNKYFNSASFANISKLISIYPNLQGKKNYNFTYKGLIFKKGKISFNQFFMGYDVTYLDLFMKLKLVKDIGINELLPYYDFEEIYNDALSNDYEHSYVLINEKVFISFNDVYNEYDEYISTQIPTNSEYCIFPCICDINNIADNVDMNITKTCKKVRLNIQSPEDGSVEVFGTICNDLNDCTDVKLYEIPSNTTREIEIEGEYYLIKIKNNSQNNPCEIKGLIKTVDYYINTLSYFEYLYGEENPLLYSI